jgi:hypothetical protein
MYCKVIEEVCREPLGEIQLEIKWRENKMEGGARSTAGAVSITTAPYIAVFSVLNNFFQLFSSFALNFKQIHTRNKKKKFEINMPYRLKRRLKKNIFFLTAVFRLPFLSAANNFCRI